MSSRTLQGAKLSRDGVCKHVQKVQYSLSRIPTRAMVTEYDRVLWHLLDDWDVCFGVGDDVVATRNKESISSCAAMQSPRDDQ
jgi:hypothetical protein